MELFKRDRTTGMAPNPEQDQDPRNLSYMEMAIFGGQIPEKGTVRQRPVEFLNQGHTLSCTHHSTVEAVHQMTGKLLSPRWGYKRVKTDSKYPSSQLPGGSCYMKDTVSLLVNEGMPLYEYLPNTPQNTVSDEEYMNFEVSEALRENARKNAGGGYIYTTLEKGSTAIFDSIVRYMAEQKRPVKVGVMFQQDFPEYWKVRKTGYYPAKSISGLGSGHDMCATDWDIIDGEPYIGFIQSFGPGWGDNGMCWMPRNYSKFYSPISVIPEVKKPTWAEVRNEHKERANAQELRAYVDLKFPRVGDPKADAQNMIAQSIYGDEKLIFINAVSYLGWKFTDVVNHLYARSRSNIDNKAFHLNFSVKRNI